MKHSLFCFLQFAILISPFFPCFVVHWNLSFANSRTTVTPSWQLCSCEKVETFSHCHDWSAWSGMQFSQEGKVEQEWDLYNAVLSPLGPCRGAAGTILWTGLWRSWLSKLQLWEGCRECISRQHCIFGWVSIRPTYMTAHQNYFAVHAFLPSVQKGKLRAPFFQHCCHLGATFLP